MIYSVLMIYSDVDDYDSSIYSFVDDDDSSIYSFVDDDDSSSYSEVTFGTTGQHNFPSWVLHAPPPDAMMCLSDLYIYTKQQKNILM